MGQFGTTLDRAVACGLSARGLCGKWSYSAADQAGALPWPRKGQRHRVGSRRAGRPYGEEQTWGWGFEEKRGRRRVDCFLLCPPG